MNISRGMQVAPIDQLITLLGDIRGRIAKTHDLSTAAWILNVKQMI